MKKQPKFRQSIDGCYNYKKLRKEGLVDTAKTDEEFIRMHTEDNSDAP